MSGLGQGAARTALIVLFWVELVLVLYGAVFGIKLQREIIRITSIDSVWLHIGAFLAVVFTAFLIWDRTPTIIAAFMLLAIVIEVAQSVIPDRTVSILDALGSSAGIVLGWVCWRIYRRLLLNKDE